MFVNGLRYNYNRFEKQLFLVLQKKKKSMIRTSIKNDVKVRFKPGYSKNAINREKSDHTVYLRPDEIFYCLSYNNII